MRAAAVSLPLCPCFEPLYRTGTLSARLRLRFGNALPSLPWLSAGLVRGFYLLAAASAVVTSWTGERDDPITEAHSCPYLCPCPYSCSWRLAVLSRTEPSVAAGERRTSDERLRFYYFNCFFLAEMPLSLTPASSPPFSCLSLRMLEDETWAWALAPPALAPALEFEARRPRWIARSYAVRALLDMNGTPTSLEC